ncbi:DUF1592 domain-containing protein [Lignipirellula cremea]|nr:DUF1592 domain-containing protein [Lignipirellula cremea]
MLNAIGRWKFRCLLAMLAACAAANGLADELIPFSKAAPILKKHCYGCHAAEKPKGDLRIDTLNPDLIQGDDGDHWREVLDRLHFGDMPPRTEPPLEAADRDLLTGWIVQEQRRAAQASHPAANFRRLTRREYERTMQDLLGLPIEFGSRLPEDGKSKEGFRNDGDALRMSPLQYEMYLQIADEALAEAIVSGPPPEVHRFRLTANQPPSVLPRPEGGAGETLDYAANDKRFTISADCDFGKEAVGVLLPAAPRPFQEAALKRPAFRYGFRLHHAYRKGETRLVVRAARGDAGPDAHFPQLAIGIGCTNMHGVELRNIGEPIVVEHTEFRDYEFRVRMEDYPLPNPGRLESRNSTVFMVWNPAKAGANPASSPKLKIEWIEFESPFFESWPPPSHEKILFDDSGLAEPEYAREVMKRFTSRAFRGPVKPAELDRLMEYWTIARQESDSLESSLRDTLSLTLTSSRFLALPASRTEDSGKQRLSDHELAARLSYFLWSSMPDETLLRLADESQLRNPSVLAGQVRRLIQDRQAWQFAEQFAAQWLELDRLERVIIDPKRYPQFNDPFERLQLLAAMRLETIHFFHEVLQADLSILSFLDSDFTLVNETLAAHYGIPEVQGPNFRKVTLDPALHRGGVLTHAGILAGLSDGSDAHPIKRGMWLLKNLLDDPPPPPPPNVPELDRENDPKLRGLTVPEALALHRSSASCNSCHVKIDPWGVAFEEYDAVGNWQREGIGAELRKRRTSHPIDSVANLPTGETVNGLQELKSELLRSQSDNFRRAMLRKVAAYALGRSLTLRDREAIDALAPALKDRGDRLSALIELIVASEPFQTK